MTHHPYKINFLFGENVVLLDCELVPKANQQYIFLFIITASSFDIDYLMGKLNYYD